jgi:hypothetical protein
MKPKKISKIAAGTLFALSLLGGKAAAQEIKAPSLENQIIQEEANPFSKIDLNFNLELQKKQGEISSYSRNCFDDEDFGFIYGSFIDKINNNLSSYLPLLKDTGSLTENQKLVLLSLYCNQVNFFAYDSKDNDCRYINTELAKFSNSIGLRAAPVTGVYEQKGQTVCLIKTKNGTSIVNSYKIMSLNTKNIEKVLEEFEKEADSLCFKHSLFEDTKFKYEFITKDGKNLLNFLGHDLSLNEAKDSLINKKDYVPHLTFNAEKTNNLFFLESDLAGMSVGGGVLSENISPENKWGLFRVGFNHKFANTGLGSISPKFNFVYGKGESKKYFCGVDGALTASTENKKGINLSSRISGIYITNQAGTNILSDLALDSGISYTSTIGNAKFEPYVLSQLALVTKDFEKVNAAIKQREIEAGFRFSFPINKVDISLEPHYTKRIWENEFGAKLRLGTKAVGLNIEDYITKSGYDPFCPDKSGLSTGIDASLGPITLKLAYKNDTTNYNGEKESISSGSISGTVKLK